MCVKNSLKTSLPSVEIKVHRRPRHQETSSMPTLNLTLIMRQSCGTDVVVLKKRLNSLHRRAVKLILPDTTLSTDQKLKEMRIMSLQKQLEYNKGLFMYRVLSNEAPGYISNLYTHIRSRCSNSRNYHLNFA